MFRVPAPDAPEGATLQTGVGVAVVQNGFALHEDADVLRQIAAIMNLDATLLENEDGTPVVAATVEATPPAVIQEEPVQQTSSAPPLDPSELTQATKETTKP